MAARVVDKLPDGEEWLYEVKFDGYRALIIKNGDRIEIRSRNDKDLTAAYPGIAAAARKLDAHQATVDGEVVAVDANGRPSFQALQHRSAHPSHAIVFYAFDLLHLDGRDLSGEPLEARRRLLPAVLDRSGILMSVDLPGDSRDVIAAVQALGLEGVIAKRRSSRYTPGDRSAVVAQAETRQATGVRRRRLSSRVPAESTRCSSATTTAVSCASPARCAPASRRACAARSPPS